MVFQKLDANSAYWQIKLRRKTGTKQPLLLSMVCFNLYALVSVYAMPPATFSRVMNLVLRGLNLDVALAFLDDVVVLGTSFDDHIKNLKQILERFKDYKLKLKPKKCSLFQRRTVGQIGLKVRQNYISYEICEVILPVEFNENIFKLR